MKANHMKVNSTHVSAMIDEETYQLQQEVYGLGYEGKISR